MPVEKAKNYYLGKSGCKRMNCAQSVVCAFKEKFKLNENIVESLSLCGGGNAPGGLCGAFYAAKCILEKDIKAGKLSELEKVFLDQAGSVKCIDIRRAKKLSCLGCIEKSSEFLAGNE